MDECRIHVICSIGLLNIMLIALMSCSKPSTSYSCDVCNKIDDTVDSALVFPEIFEPRLLLSLKGIASRPNDTTLILHLLNNKSLSYIDTPDTDTRPMDWPHAQHTLVKYFPKIDAFLVAKKSNERYPYCLIFRQTGSEFGILEPPVFSIDFRYFTISRADDYADDYSFAIWRVDKQGAQIAFDTSFVPRYSVGDVFNGIIKPRYMLAPRNMHWIKNSIVYGCFSAYSKADSSEVVTIAKSETQWIVTSHMKCHD